MKTQIVITEKNMLESVHSFEEDILQIKRKPELLKSQQCILNSQDHTHTDYSCMQ